MPRRPVKVECHNCRRPWRAKDVYLVSIQKQEPENAPREVYAFCYGCIGYLIHIYEMELPEDS